MQGQCFRITSKSTRETYYLSNPELFSFPRIFGKLPNLFQIWKGRISDHMQSRKQFKIKYQFCLFRMDALIDRRLAALVDLTLAIQMIEEGQLDRSSTIRYNSSQCSSMTHKKVTRCMNYNLHYSEGTILCSDLC